MLERFGGYTLRTLMDEDPLLLRLVKIEALGKPPESPSAPPM
jgi:hypothetical protein